MYCALLFIADANLSDREYWYKCAFPLVVGDRVIAPVGIHNKLQLGRVVRVVAEPPFDIRLMKEVVAREGDRVLYANGVRAFEAGGVRYDGKHYTRYHQALFAEKAPVKRDQFMEYGVTRFLRARGEETIKAIAHTGACVLVYGEGADQTGAALLAILKGERESDLTEREKKWLAERFL